MPKPKSESKETPRPSPTEARIGINILDLGRIDEVIRGCMRLHEVLDQDSAATAIVDRDKIDEVCTPFTCELLRAACLCDVIRRKDRREQRYPTRVYLKKKGNWVKIPGTADLAVAIDEQVVLNPELFPPEKVAAPATAAPPRRRMD